MSRSARRAPHIAQRLPFFYGWVVVAIAFVSIGIAVNLRTSFSILFPPILSEFGWGRGVTAGAFSLGFFSTAVSTPLIGMIMDRFGPRVVLPMGAAMVGAGFLLVREIETPVGFYLTMGLLVVGGSIPMTYIGHSMFLPNWFVRKRGLAVGIAFSGVGVFALLFPRLQDAIEAIGWRDACLILAGLSLVVVIPLNALFQRQRPADLGLEPDGDAAAPPGPQSADGKPVVPAQDWTVAAALRTKRIWWVSLGYFMAMIAWYSIVVHQTQYLLDVGFDPRVAAWALGYVAVFGVVGQIGMGALSDRFSREVGWGLSLLGFVICYALLLMLEGNPNPVLMWGMVISQGVLGYGLSSLYGAITADLFPGPRFATIFGLTATIGNLGAAFGPWATGLVFDYTGSYALAFQTTIGLCAVSMFAIWMAAPRNPRPVGQ